MTARATCNYKTCMRLKQRILLTQKKIDSLQKTQEIYKYEVMRLTRELRAEGIEI